MVSTIGQEKKWYSSNYYMIVTYANYYHHYPSYIDVLLPNE